MQKFLSKAEMRGTNRQPLERLDSVSGLLECLRSLDYPSKSRIGLKRKCRIISHICIYEVMLYKKYILGRKEN